MVKTDKSILKQYFRSGSRPTQKQFYELIDNCYNEAAVSYVSGYHLLIDIDKDVSIHSLKREAGKTILVPFFNRINTIHHRIYHYSIPVSNVGSGVQLEKIILELRLPKNTQYKVRDRNREVSITQQIKFDYIRVFNGTEEIFNFSPDNNEIDPVQEYQINKSAKSWRGIAIDFSIIYDIKSDIAVSDQFELTADNKQVLEHIFGSAGCIFRPKE